MRAFRHALANSALPPSRIPHHGRPCPLVMVTAPLRPACATISAFSWYFAFSTRADAGRFSMALSCRVCSLIVMVPTTPAGLFVVSMMSLITALNFALFGPVNNVRSLHESSACLLESQRPVL